MSDTGYMLEWIKKKDVYLWNNGIRIRLSFILHVLYNKMMLGMMGVLVLYRMFHI